jgi:hypothetical protein
VGLPLPVLTTMLPSLPAMMPSTAVAFIAAGVALWLLGPEQAGRRRHRAGQGLALLVALFGLMVLGQYLTGWPLAPDRWLFGDQLTGLGMRFPGRPSPHTALTFVLVGLALGLLDTDRRRGHRLALVLAPLSVAVALVALLGYVYQVRNLYELSQVTGMALPTVATFLVLTTRLLACRPDRQPTRTFVASSPGGCWPGAPSTTNCWRPSGGSGGSPTPPPTRSCRPTATGCCVRGTRAPSGCSAGGPRRSSVAR